MCTKCNSTDTRYVFDEPNKICACNKDQGFTREKNNEECVCADNTHHLRLRTSQKDLYSFVKECA